MAAVRMSFTKSFLNRRRNVVEDFQQQDPPKKYNLVPGVGIISYLPLQMSLYFNVFYSPLWAVAMVLALETKFTRLMEDYKYVNIAVLIVMLIIEALRLFLGYEGNLREKVPELAGFWLLTLFQLPLVVYSMSNVRTIILPLEWAFCIPLSLFLLVEIASGARALQLMIRAQSVKFQLSRMHPGLEAISTKRRSPPKQDETEEETLL